MAVRGGGAGVGTRSRARAPVWEAAVGVGVGFGALSARGGFGGWGEGGVVCVQPGAARERGLALGWGEGYVDLRKELVFGRAVDAEATAGAVAGGRVHGVHARVAHGGDHAEELVVLREDVGAVTVAVVGGGGADAGGVVALGETEAFEVEECFWAAGVEEVLHRMPVLVHVLSLEKRRG